MAFEQSVRGGTSALSPDEVEFQAEDELITVVPNFKQAEVRLITGTYGPFRPQVPTEVPMWLAVLLKARSKCALVPPAWMAEDALTAALERERTDARVQPLPYHYLETAQLLLRHAKDDVPSPYRVRNLVEDLRAARAAKIGASVARVVEAAVLKVNNLGGMEINCWRPALAGALAAFAKCEAADAEDAREAPRVAGGGAPGLPALHRAEPPAPRAGGEAGAAPPGGRKLRPAARPPLAPL